MVEEELSKIEPNNTKSFDSQEEVFQEEEEKVSYNPVTQPTIENRQQFITEIDQYIMEEKEEEEESVERERALEELRISQESHDQGNYDEYDNNEDGGSEYYSEEVWTEEEEAESKKNR